MKKILSLLVIMMPATTTLLPISLNPISYLQTEIPALGYYAASSAAAGVVVGAGIAMLPNHGACGAVKIAGAACLLGKTLYDGLNSQQEQENCEWIAAHYNDQINKRIAKTTFGVQLTNIQPLKAEQFKVKHESHRNAAVLGGFLTGVCIGNTLGGCVAYGCTPLYDYQANLLSMPLI